MKLSVHIVLVVAALAALSPARAQTASRPQTPSGPVYVVTYFEVAPAATRRTDNLLRQFAAASRRENGNLEFLALREIARPGHFATVEAWHDKAALEAHDAAGKALAGKLQADFTAPFDARQFLPLSVVGPAAGADLTGAIYALTHIDVFPTYKDQAAALVKQQVDDSRKDPGRLRYDALVWDGHPNHFHLIEAWADRKTREAHALAEHTRQFRAKLVPFEGGLYDQRLYEAVK